jgi:hypothetical protein
MSYYTFEHNSATFVLPTSMCKVYIANKTVCVYTENMGAYDKATKLKVVQEVDLPAFLESLTK